MIVKNEAAVIARCLKSVIPHITHAAIVDTGSTDDTIKIVCECLGRAGIPYTIATLPWKGFAGSRNDALERARESGADYALFIDADEVLDWPASEKQALSGKLIDDVYGIRFYYESNEMTWARTLLAKLSLPWKWVGDVHEYLDCAPHDPTKVMIIGAKVLSYKDGARSRLGDHTKYLTDAETLRAMLAKDPDNSRYQFYLAQSLMGAMQIPAAIEAYEKRAKMGGWGEEVFYSLFQIAALKEYQGRSIEELTAAHLRAYESRPTRAEPLWALAVLYNDREMPAVAEVYARAALRIPRPGDNLLVMESVYQYRAADELAAALGRLKRYDEALVVLEALVKVKGLPEPELQRARENIDFIRAERKDAAKPEQATALAAAVGVA